MPRTSQNLRTRIMQAAQNRCEYCQTLQKMTLATFHLDHIIPLAAGGATEFENLCLSCPLCNEFKAGTWRARDPRTGHQVRLYNPRREGWHKHFQWGEDGTLVIGLTARGRATVDALRLNNQIAQTARKFWVASGGIHPPKQAESRK